MFKYLRRRYGWIHRDRWYLYIYIDIYHCHDMSKIFQDSKNWLVVDLPLWNKWVNWDDDIPNWMGKYKSCSSHHQPAKTLRHSWWNPNWSLIFQCHSLHPSFGFTQFQPSRFIKVHPNHERADLSNSNYPLVQPQSTNWKITMHFSWVNSPLNDGAI